MNANATKKLSVAQQKIVDKLNEGWSLQRYIVAERFGLEYVRENMHGGHYVQKRGVHEAQ